MKEGTVTDRLARVLFVYRNTPHSTTGVPPAELMFGRKLRGQFDILKPSVETTVEYHQERQKLNHDQHSRMRSFSERETVFFRNFGPGETWLAGTITRVSAMGLHNQYEFWTMVALASSTVAMVPGEGQLGSSDNPHTREQLARCPGPFPATTCACAPDPSYELCLDVLRAALSAHVSFQVAEPPPCSPQNATFF